MTEYVQIKAVVAGVDRPEVVAQLRALASLIEEGDAPGWSLASARGNVVAEHVEAVSAVPPANLPTMDPENILSDPTASYWLKKALRSALERDVVDAANDAELLAMVLSARCDSVQGSSKVSERKRAD